LRRFSDILIKDMSTKKAMAYNVLLVCLSKRLYGANEGQGKVSDLRLESIIVRGKPIKRLVDRNGVDFDRISFTVRPTT